MLSAKSMCAGMFTLAVLSVGCAETDKMETLSTDTPVKVESQQAQEAATPKPAEDVLVQFKETYQKEGQKEPVETVWEVRFLDGWLKLYQGDQFVHQIKKAKWYQTVRPMLELDKFKKFEGKRLAYENEKSFWQEVRDRGLSSYGDAELASRKIEEAEEKLQDLLASVTYQRLLGVQSAYETLNGAIGGKRQLNFASGTQTEEANLLVLLFDPFKK